MTICAVVVTFNRLNLLKECIESIRNQTRKLDEILIVNNSSTDGTLEWLDEQPDLTVITQPNSGGAGGFHTGIKAAYEKGHDWIWCMDDDCLCDNRALSYLIQSTNKNVLVIGPIIIDRRDFSTLSSRILIESESTSVLSSNLEEAKYLNKNSSIVKGDSAFFNGILINRRIIENVGLPLKDLFIWGDEVEYSKRIRKSKYDLFTHLDAIVYHPHQRWKLKIGIFNNFVYTGPFDDKAFYFFRNSAFIAKRYNKYFNLRFILAQLFNIVFLNKNKVRKTVFFLKAYYRGLKSEF